MREATELDTPRGGEVQCPACWRMFANHATADKHETWSRGKGKADAKCHDPADKGLVEVERRGVIIWYTPEGSERARQKAELLSGARAVRAKLASGD